MTATTKPREIGLPFTTDMVMAIQNGNKTETRRILDGAPEKVTYPSWGFSAFTPPGHISVRGHFGHEGEYGEKFVKLRYLQGDHGWIRETYAKVMWPGPDESGKIQDGIRMIYHYRAEKKNDIFVKKWIGPRFMPKAAARLWVEITGVTVERLTDITDEAATREGIQEFTKDGTVKKYGLEGWRWDEMPRTPREAFLLLWEKIHGPGSIERNPWVTVNKFKVITKTAEDKPCH